jgi:hypothetical protein
VVVVPAALARITLMMSTFPVLAYVVSSAPTNTDIVSRHVGGSHCISSIVLSLVMSLVAFSYRVAAAVRASVTICMNNKFSGIVM